MKFGVRVGVGNDKVNATLIFKLSGQNRTEKILLQLFLLSVSLRMRIIENINGPSQNEMEVITFFSFFWLYYKNILSPPLFLDLCLHLLEVLCLPKFSTVTS